MDIRIFYVFSLLVIDFLFLWLIKTKDKKLKKSEEKNKVAVKIGAEYYSQIVSLRNRVREMERKGKEDEIYRKNLIEALEEEERENRKLYYRNKELKNGIIREDA